MYIRIFLWLKLFFLSMLPLFSVTFSAMCVDAFPHTIFMFADAPHTCVIACMHSHIIHPCFYARTVMFTIIEPFLRMYLHYYVHKFCRLVCGVCTSVNWQQQEGRCTGMYIIIVVELFITESFLLLHRLI